MAATAAVSLHEPEDDFVLYDIPPTPPPFSIEDSEDVYLARLVLAQAVQDAQLPSNSNRRTCARAFLTNRNPDLEHYCQVGRINVEYLLEIKRRQWGRVPWPKNYLEVFDKEKQR